MIKIDRNRIRMPKVLGPESGAPGRKETEKAIEHYNQTIQSREQNRFRFKIYADRTVREALKKLFYNKCAYCESKFLNAPFDIEQYRPKSGVIGAKGDHYMDHYFWLANEWTNLLTACQYCNRKSKVQLFGGEWVISGKGNQFPIKDERKRAPLMATEQQLKEEEPLILNPCEDDPEQHLIFSENGTVVSETPAGQMTIEILGLNRMSLVEARYQKLLMIKAQKVNFDQVLHLQDKDAIEAAYKKLDEFRQPDQEFAGLARQFLSSYVLSKDMADTEIDQVKISKNINKKVAEIEKGQKKMQRQVKKATKAYKTFRHEQQHYSLEHEEGLEKYFSGPARFIDKVSIRNLKSIKSIDINLTGIDNSNVPWTMILGENGTGKSTILKAIAIALIGKNYYHELVEKELFDPKSFLRWGAKEGSISLSITGFTNPRKVLFYANGNVEFTDSESAQNLLLAYGSTRLMPRGKTDLDYGKDYARVDNLFNPFLPMANANLWLTSLPQERFDYTALKLKNLLKLPKNDILFQKDEIVYVQTVDGAVPINDLSDGYQSMMALIADILKVVLSKWPSPESAQGIVLLDEVGNHLHPEWKMRFVSEMRAFFPGIQFIASTHNPLCLYGLQDGELVVMRRTPKGSIFQVKDLPSINGLRVDQLLTSEHFGLGSATDPGTQALMDEYYQLLRRKTKDEAKIKRIYELKKEIDQRQGLGKTERERMLLEVIDQFLAEKRFTKTTSAKNILKDKTMQKLREIWDS